MLDQNQLLIGISVLLSFFVGYKYGLKISRKGDITKFNEKPRLTPKFFADDEELDSPGTSQKSRQSTAPRGNYKMVLVSLVTASARKSAFSLVAGHWIPILTNHFPDSIAGCP